jgi:hypothetical protein
MNMNQLVFFEYVVGLLSSRFSFEGEIFFQDPGFDSEPASRKFIESRGYKVLGGGGGFKARDKLMSEETFLFTPIRLLKYITSYCLAHGHRALLIGYPIDNIFEKMTALYRSDGTPEKAVPKEQDMYTDYPGRNEYRLPFRDNLEIEIERRKIT